jgi:TorA maturation chaperone TorD
MTAADTRVAAALWRSAVYGVLAKVFDRPTSERLQTVRARARTAARAREVPADVRAALSRLGSAAAGADAETVATEHAMLFDGPVRCSPYEGAWGPQQMSGKAAELADVAGFYLAFELSATTWNAELEDHVAAECEFLGALALKEAWALAAGLDEAVAVTRDAGAAFLCDHLGRWGQAFADELGRQASRPLYKEAARLLDVWLAAEVARLGVAPARVLGATEAENTPFACPMMPPADS